MFARCDKCGDPAVERCSEHKHSDYKYLCQECYDQLIQEQSRPLMGDKCKTCEAWNPEEFASECEDLYLGIPLRCEFPEEPKYNPDLDKNLTKIKVFESPERWLKQISEEYYNQEVYIVKDNTRKDTTKTLVDILNERFVRKQLVLNNRLANNRDMYYQILTRRGFIDLKGESLQQQISLDGAVSDYCEKLTDFFNAPYWGYIQEELSIMSSARTTAYSISGKEYEMNRNNITQKFFGTDKNEFYEMIRKTPFFFIICEKELVIRETMEALKDLGYTEGFLGFSTQGYASTYLIKTLIEYGDKISKKFCVFSLHDLDAGGIKIFLDMKRYFHVESAGINPELMRRCGIDFTGKGVKYRGKTGEAKPSEIKGAITIIEDLYNRSIIDDDEKREYEEWVNICSKERYELQAITGVRLDEDMEQNPARDYAEYIQHKIEDFERKWDINRLQEPRAITPDFYEFNVKIPSFITEIIGDLQNKIEDTINAYLETKNLKNLSDWKELLSEKYGNLEKHEYNENVLNIIRKIQEIYGRVQAIHLRKKNKRYTESLKNVRRILRKQDRGLWDLHYSQNRVLRKRKKRLKRLMHRLYRKMPEYQEIKDTLEKVQKEITETLEKLEFEVEI